MIPQQATSDLRIEKARIDALVTLTDGGSAAGHFFVAKGSARYTGPERVGELLNAETGFFPFETHDARGPRTVLYNRRHVVMVALADNEACRDPGYEVATERFVRVLLSNGHRVTGSVRVYRPEGRDRLSDWARHSDPFRYLETADATLLINIAHVIEVSEVSEP